ncbi:MAG: RNA-binding S4 domain-containing protein, partial [bacterium]
MSSRARRRTSSRSEPRSSVASRARVLSYSAVRAARQSIDRARSPGGGVMVDTHSLKVTPFRVKVVRQITAVRLIDWRPAMRLDLALIAVHPELSRRKAREVIEKGQVTLRGETVQEPGRLVRP